MTFPLKTIAILCLACVLTSTLQAGQVSDERTIGRYLSLLEKRPAAGAAFDRVYLHYQGAGRIDELIQKLQPDGTGGPTTAARQLLLGMVFLRQQQPELAINVLTLAADGRPTDATVDQQLAKAWLQQSRFAEAAAALESAIGKTESRAASLQLVNELVSVCQKLRQPEKALKALKSFEDRFPGDTEIQALLATTLIEAGRSEEAIAHLDTLISAATAPENRLRLESQRADVLQQTGKTSEAVKAYSQILERLNPESWQAEELDGKIQSLLARQPNSKQLEDYLKQRIRRRPEAVAYKAELIKFLHGQGRFEDSLAVAADSGKQRNSPVVLRATIEPLLSLNRFDEVNRAYNQLESAAQLSHDDIIRWGNLVLNHSDRTSSDVQAAISIWDKLLDASIGSQPDWERHALVADTLGKAGLSDEAASHYATAIRSNAAAPSVFSNYAAILFRQEDTTKAVQVLKALVDRHPESMSSFDVAIQSLRQFQHNTEATDFAKRLVGINPANQHRLLLAELLLEQGKFGDADRQLALVLEGAETQQQKAVQQQVVDLLLKTDSVGPKYRQLQQKQDLSDEGWLLLAKLAEVQGDLAVALQSVEQLKDDSPLRVQALELQAGLQQKAGQLQAAEQTLHRLAVRNPRQAATYSQSIQNLQLQMGRTDEAYQTASQLFMQSATSAAAVDRYVSFLKNSDRPTEAISVLNDFLSKNGSSAAMMVELSDLLAEQFRTNEAVGWLWRAFERSASDAQRRDIASRLVMLGLRTNQATDILQRLRSTIQQDSSLTSVHRTLLMADAYRQARQLSDAADELEAFVRSDASAVAAVTELVDVLSEQNRIDEAFSFQLQLAERQPTAENFNRLAELLQLRNDITGVASKLKQIAQHPEWRKPLLAVIDRLLDNGQPDEASNLLDTLQGTGLEAWQYQFRRIRIAVWRGEVDTAVLLSRQYVESAASPSDLLTIATAPVNLRLARATSEAEVRAFAWHWAVSDAALQIYPLSDWLVRWRTELEGAKSSAKKMIPSAELGIALSTAKLVQPTEVLLAVQSIGEQKSEDADVAALGLLLAIDTSDIPPEPDDRGNGKPSWFVEYGKQAVDLVGRVQKSNPTVLTTDAIRLIHERLVNIEQLAAAKRLRQMMMLSPQPPSSREPSPNQLIVFWQIAEQSSDLQLANAILDEWLKPDQLVLSSEARLQLPEHLGRSMAMFCSLGTVEDRAQLLQKFLRLKTSSGVSARSIASESDRPLFEVRWTEKTSHRLFENGRHVGSRNVVTLPQNSRIIQTDITFFVNLMHGLNDQQQSSLTAACQQFANRQTTSSTIVSCRLAAAHLYCLQSEFDLAILQVIEAAKAAPTVGFLRVQIAAYHAKNGNALSALNLLETVAASDIDAYQQALWLKLQIGNSSGQREVAEQAAASLFGTRLTQAERRHLQLVTKRKQLNAGSAKSSDAISKSLRPMEQLVNQMKSMQSAGQFDKAIEAANSILLTSDATQHTTRLTTSARQAAIAILAEHNRLETALGDVDRRLQGNQNSTDLLRLKRQVLKGMNQTGEVAKVEARLAQLIPATPENQIQSGQELEEVGQYSAAADQYLKAFRIKPALLLADYYRYFKVFRRVDRLAELAQLLIESDLRQLRDNYFVISELIDVLLAQSDSDEPGRRCIEMGFGLLNAAWDAFPGDRDYLLNNIQAQRLWESSTVVDYICDSLIPDSPQQAFARPWLGLDSTPVSVEGEGLLCPLQRVLLYLKNKEARSEFLDRVVAGRKNFPTWLAGPYLEVALNRNHSTDQQNRTKLMALLDSVVSGDPRDLPPDVVATNLVRTLRGRGPDVDARLAEFYRLSTHSVRQKSQTPFHESRDRLLAELQFSAGRRIDGRATVVRALRRAESETNRSVDAEATWNHIHSVVAAVELLRANGMILDAAAEAVRISPLDLTFSRGFQSNDSVDRSCQRMWQLAKYGLANAKADDVMTYLQGQQDDFNSKRSVELDLMLKDPTWGDRIGWSNSDLLSVLIRLGKTDQGGVNRIQEQLKKLEVDQLSISVCRLALQSQRVSRDEYESSVKAFAVQTANLASMENLRRNAVITWCLADSLNRDDATRQLILQIALSASSDDLDLSVWKHCILNQAAEQSRQSGQQQQAADEWTRSLNQLLPPLTPRSPNAGTPLKETRKLLLNP